MLFKGIHHLILNKTLLITSSSKNISSENLGQKTAFFGKKNILLVPCFLYTQLYLTLLEQYPFLASLGSFFCQECSILFKTFILAKIIKFAEKLSEKIILGELVMRYNVCPKSYKLN